MSQTAHKEAMTDLTAALAHFDLKPADIPGLAEAWAETFAPLDEPLPPMSAQVARSMFDDDLPDDVKYVRIVDDGEKVWVDVTVEGGYDERTIRFRADAEQARILREAQKGDKVRAELAGLERTRAAYLSGERAPWNLLADADEVSAARDAVRELAQKVQRGTYRADSATAFLRTREELRAGAVTGVFPEHLRNDRYQRRLGDYRLNDVFRIEAALISDTEEHRVMQAALAEAEALPAGALRDFLLAERPERSYSATEGKGRSKRTVTKTYRPVSELSREVKSAGKAFERATREHAEMAAKLDELAATHQETLSAHEEAIAQHDAAAERLFLLGLPTALHGISRTPLTTMKDWA